MENCWLRARGRSFRFDHSMTAEQVAVCVLVLTTTVGCLLHVVLLSRKYLRARRQISPASFPFADLAALRDCLLPVSCCLLPNFVGSFEHRLQQYRDNQRVNRVAATYFLGASGHIVVFVIEVINLGVVPHQLGALRADHATYVLFASVLPIHAVFSLSMVLCATCPELIQNGKARRLSYTVWMFLIGLKRHVSASPYDLIYQSSWMAWVRLFLALIVDDLFVTIALEVIFVIGGVFTFANLVDEFSFGIVNLQVTILAFIVSVAFIVSNERRRSNEVFLTLWSMFESQNDASCICDVRGTILLASPQLLTFTCRSEPINGSSLGDFAASNDEKKRLVEFLSRVDSSGDKRAQALQVSFAGDGVITDKNDATLSVIKCFDDFAASGRWTPQHFMIGFKIHTSEFATISDEISCGHDCRNVAMLPTTTFGRSTLHQQDSCAATTVSGEASVGIMESGASVVSTNKALEGDASCSVAAASRGV
eukprot:TRINITY_DN43195_c0_g1_i1.p1 TRINITY_DN43195_c0_g1~~TRINITY_DN43195_c0_g1_i1.p1  ORF type:complete len:493 (-),score=45.55 TRINITY_DN43195_c0_g1_i1:87-1529(-)